MNAGVVIVTGGSRGIGSATALQLARAGYRVCVNYIVNKEAAVRVVADIESTGGTAIAVQADVSLESDVVSLFEAVDEQLGPLSALVNNAGILLPQTRVEDMDGARIDKILHTNVTSYFLCCREAVRRMSRKHGGSGGAIVNVSS